MKHNCNGSHSRRDFMRLAGVTGVGAGLLKSRGTFAAEGEEPTAEAKKAKVAVVQDSSIKQAVRDAVAISGGLDFIKPGQRVLIKPNATGGVKHPCCTNPE